MLTSFYWFRVLSLSKKKKYSTLKLPKLLRNSNIYLNHNKPMCEFKSVKHKSFTPDPSATLPYLHLMKKRSLCKFGEKLDKKHYVKRHLFSSRLSSDAEMGTDNMLDISSYIFFKSRYISKPQPISSYLTSFKEIQAMMVQ